MKIFVNENGQTVDVKENRFVANAAWFDNVIDIYYAGDNYDLSYVIISFKRADGFVILNKVAAAYPDNEDGFMWRYTIPEYGGVLDIAGQLEVSAQLIKAYYNEGETVAYKREIRASVSATATVRINIGISNQEEYDAVAEEFSEINNDITGRINAIVNDIGTEDMGTIATTIKGAIAEHEGELIDHEERIDAAETTIADHESRIDTAETTIADHENRIDAAETTLINHESRIGIAESSITNHENRLSVAEDTIAEHEGDIIDHEERINEAEATIIDHGNDIGGIKADIGTASISGIAVDIKAAINSLNSDIDSLQQGIVHRAIRGLITSPTASTLTPALSAAMTGYIETSLGRAPNLTDAIAVRDTEDADLSMIFTYYYWTATASDSTEGWYLAAHYKTPAFTETPAFTLSYSEDDWSADADENGLYKFSIDAATHGMGATSNLLIRMLKLIGSDYIQISQFYVAVDGTVTLYTDDKTLTGIIVISTSTAYYVPALTEYGSVSVTNVIGIGDLAIKDTVGDDDITADSNLEESVLLRHTHTNKALLDTYTQTESDIADAVSKKHIHNNKALLDTYTQTESDIADAISKEHTHSNKAVLDTITSIDKTKLDGLGDLASKDTVAGADVSNGTISTGTTLICTKKLLWSGSTNIGHETAFTTVYTYTDGATINGRKFEIEIAKSSSSNMTDKTLVFIPNYAISTQTLTQYIEFSATELTYITIRSSGSSGNNKDMRFRSNKTTFTVSTSTVATASEDIYVKAIYEIFD